ncbi:hypothetical protein FCI58_30635 [Enterobacter hormaechei]|nr:hypothetical protein [Enterobacter hormaechei]
MKEEKGNQYITEEKRKGRERYEEKTLTRPMMAEREEVRWPETREIRENGELVVTESRISDHF